MKRVIPKLLYFYLIPWGAALLFTVIDCVFNIMYLDWLWIPDFCMVVFDMLSYYLLEIAAFSIFGISSAYIFFGRRYRAVLLSFAGLATAAVFPYSRYLIQHMLLPAALQDLEMLNCFIEAGLFAQTLLMNGILFLLASLLTKMFFGLILKKRDELPTKMVSLRNPQNFASLIFCVAAVLLATILFFSVGEYAFEDILALVVEYAVNAVRFFILVFVSFVTVRWNRKVYQKV